MYVYMFEYVELEWEVVLLGHGKLCVQVSLKTQRAGGETPGGETGEFYAMSLF